jgi:drug/metabolite transporter (DMT)-like permease
MISFGIGEAAALITALSWTVSCQVHTMAGRIVGAGGVAIARVPLYAGSVGLVALVTATHYSLPLEALVFLACSAMMGITIGDPAFYSACVIVGPRLTLLLQSLSSALAAVLGFLFLDERIGLTGVAGILIATCGVAFVLMEGGFKTGTDLGSLPRALLFKGLGMGFLSAMSLAVSFILLKKALLTDIDPVFAAFVRLGIGGSLIWIIAALRGQLLPTMRRAWTDKPTVRLFLLGMVVSLLGNSLVPIAMKYTATGVAATLIGLQPVLIIPLVAFVDKKRPSLRAVIGTSVAFAGSAMLFLR